VIAVVTAVATLVALLVSAVTAAILHALWPSGGETIRLAASLEFAAIEVILLIGVFERRAPIFGRVFWRGRRDTKVISITFDDGPSESYTNQILDVLKESHVEATFFVLGERVKRHPDIVRRQIAEGHEVQNHGYGHTILALKSPASVRRELETTSDVIQGVTGVRPTLLRVPHGWRNPWVSRVARELDLRIVAWTLGVWDTDRPGSAVIVRRALEGLGNGCVLLLHDGRGREEQADCSQVVDALPAIITEARKAGYSFSTLSRMIAEAQAR
jgi:peptidoglycan/xylan/chitin deacetylase (PgdA/CDA1 family)